MTCRSAFRFEKDYYSFEPDIALTEKVVLEKRKRGLLGILWVFLCVFGVVCIVVGMFFYLYIERRKLLGFNYYYYVYPFSEYAFPTFLVGLSSLIVGFVVLVLSMSIARKIETSQMH